MRLILVVEVHEGSEWRVRTLVVSNLFILKTGSLSLLQLRALKH